MICYIHYTVSITAVVTQNAPCTVSFVKDIHKNLYLSISFPSINQSCRLYTNTPKKKNRLQKYRVIKYYNRPDYIHVTMLKLHMLSEEQASSEINQRGTKAFLEWEKTDNQEQGSAGGGL